MGNPLHIALVVRVSTSVPWIGGPVGSVHYNWEARASVCVVAWGSVVAGKDEKCRTAGERDCLDTRIVQEGRYSEALM